MVPDRCAARLRPPAGGRHAKYGPPASSDCGRGGRPDPAAQRGSVGAAAARSRSVGGRRGRAPLPTGPRMRMPDTRPVYSCRGLGGFANVEDRLMWETGRGSGWRPGAARTGVGGSADAADRLRLMTASLPRMSRTADPRDTDASPPQEVVRLVTGHAPRDRTRGGHLPTRRSSAAMPGGAGSSAGAPRVHRCRVGAIGLRLSQRGGRFVP